MGKLTRNIKRAIIARHLRELRDDLCMVLLITACSPDPPPVATHPRLLTVRDTKEGRIDTET